jgi:hypothetical protein
VVLDWWCAHISAAYRNRIQFPASVVARRGTEALVEEPKVVIGTIHSVKGGEADVVYLFPDLSRAGADQYQIAGPPRDSVIRVSMSVPRAPGIRSTSASPQPG